MWKTIQVVLCAADKAWLPDCTLPSPLQGLTITRILSIFSLIYLTISPAEPAGFVDGPEQIESKGDGKSGAGHAENRHAEHQGDGLAPRLADEERGRQYAVNQSGERGVQPPMLQVDVKGWDLLVGAEEAGTFGMLNSGCG